MPLPGKLCSPEPIKMTDCEKTYGSIWVRRAEQDEAYKGLGRVGPSKGSEILAQDITTGFRRSSMNLTLRHAEVRA